MPRLITSIPAARLAAIFRSSSANRYGGIRWRRLVGCTELVPDDLGTDLLEIELAQLLLVADADGALGVADLNVLEAPGAPRSLELPLATLSPRRIVGAAQPRPAHVHRALGAGRDPRPDLSGGRLDRERVLLGPAASPQVQNRLARPVTRQLGLRAVGIEDPQA